MVAIPEPVVDPEKEAINQFLVLLNTLIKQKDVAVAERDQAKSESAQLLKVQGEHLDALHELIDTASKATVEDAPGGADIPLGVVAPPTA